MTMKFRSVMGLTLAAWVLAMLGAVDGKALCVKFAGCLAVGGGQPS